MEAVVDAAIAAGVFALAVGVVVVFALSGGSMYLSYTEDAMVRAEARAVTNFLKGYISRSSKNLLELNPSYVGRPAMDLTGFRVDFVARISFPQRIAISQAGASPSFPSQVFACPTGPGKGVAVSRYGVGITGMRPDPNLVKIESDGTIRANAQLKVCSFTYSDTIEPGALTSVFTHESPIVFYTDGGSYVVVPSAYPEAVLAFVKGRSVDPSSVRVPSDAVYVSDSTIMENGVSITIEVWAWSGGAM
ncbi:MAG: hypothetical protein QXO17_06940 [Nitrososphaerota archaeon]|nr:hypothetical protein [Candidatus Calditenuis fumarioli]